MSTTFCILVNISEFTFRYIYRCYMFKILKYFLFCNIFFSEITFCGMLFPQGGGGVARPGLKKFTDPVSFLRSLGPLGGWLTWLASSCPLLHIDSPPHPTSSSSHLLLILVDLAVFGSIGLSLHRLGCYCVDRAVVGSIGLTLGRLSWRWAD